MRVLVTGTDSDVGKTWVACALARALLAAGRTVTALKVVDAGVGDAPSADEDGAVLAAATGQPEPRRALRRLRTPIAPAAAAELEGVTLDFDELTAEIERLAAGADVTLIEGAGGLLTPVGWDWSVADLAAALGARALVVGSDRLGTVNHALLTLGALELAGVAVAGVVLTTPAQRDESTGTNANMIARIAGIGNVATAPLTDDPLAAAVAMKDVVGWLLDSPP
jgi:dethiobiotin synthetase